MATKKSSRTRTKVTTSTVADSWGSPAAWSFQERPASPHDRFKIEIDWIQRVAKWLDPTTRSDRLLRGYGLDDPRREQFGREARAPESVEPHVAAQFAKSQVNVERQMLPGLISDADYDTIISVLNRVVAGARREDLFGEGAPVSRIAERMKHANVIINELNASGLEKWEHIAPLVILRLGQSASSPSPGEPAGNALTAPLDKIADEVEQALKRIGRPATITEVAGKSGRNPRTTKKRLEQLRAAGRVVGGLTRGDWQVRTA